MAEPRTLVTGATGFLGKALSRRLTELGHRMYPVAHSLGTDLATPGCLEGFLGEGIETVFHLAGRTFIPESWRQPASFYAVNFSGTQQVLDFCRLSGASIVFVSAYVYGTPLYLPVDEAHPTLPNNPYGHSKWLGEELCRFYARHFGVRATILRPFNLYGPDQRPPFLIPTLLQQLVTGEVIVKDSRPKRDYLHVDDFVAACLLAKGGTTGCPTYNVGSGASYSVEAIIEKLIRAYPGTVTWRSLNERRPDEIDDVLADNRAIREALGWTPQVSFEQGLADLVRFQLASKIR